ncbi:MAG: hypothetical protein M1548_01645 [Actinobacteria bacterium]|nr:hypothetical protein [Actinomycetota bacterium]
MGYFDGMKNQKELEIYFKKLVSAFISLAEDLDREPDEDEETLIMSPVIPLVISSKTP